MRTIALLFAYCIAMSVAAQPKSWTADNGNGTFTNPLLYDEFSDPDIIRVGDDYYLAGTTMHTVPGLEHQRQRPSVLHKQGHPRSVGAPQYAGQHLRPKRTFR